MVETITPVVYGSRARYRIAVIVHALAAATAGGFFGAVLGLAGMLLVAPWGTTGLIAIAVIAGVYALRELVGLPIPLFDRKQQVPDWWRTFYSPVTAAALYGGGLGIGFLTFLGHGTYVAACATAVASGDPVIGALLGASFGLARGAGAVVNARSMDEEAAALRVRRLESIASTRTPQIVNGLTCLTLAVTAVRTLL
ncbi:MAG TPA: hypothetical protein VG929_04830 [Actinomycetota bacterium]|nr:hypothetical protein [Actinomycetota bacterium]